MDTYDNFEPQWKIAHENQLDLTSDNHSIYVLEGASHYLWYTHLDEMVDKILDWQS